MGITPIERYVASTGSYIGKIYLSGFLNYITENK
ncbi:hypothetical protein ALC53_13242 [Atta colombica]|uniref:Uncharacterized protein n=1 Tax=Atta colombica TaxID=520822 RepID=A0A195AW11_9HYME|nr:hypothetical protein ALC53_13242 [Atta colombica]